jgi:CheY-like chemotaxis protein
MVEGFLCPLNNTEDLRPWESGGRHVAKILVADDNSNVQKTVSLALADLGVEVVAVNNGEAAVRKFAEVAPDLVLADIFMPVRNGYEVCEFVKRDSRFSHIPVVLLVGAFDPLDEREAQRVNADGILKKPFVPPDPLIAMVKTLLDRTLGDRLVGVGVSKPAVAMQSNAGGVATAEEHPSATKTPEEEPEEHYRPKVGRLTFGEGQRPVAFGQLLETPVQESAAAESGVVEPVDDEQILTSSRDASLGDPIFWRTEEPNPETEEEHLEGEEDISSAIPMQPWKPDEEAVSRAEAEYLHPVDSYELVREATEEEAGKAPTIVEPSSLIAQDAASQASLTVESAKAEDLAANPIEWMASVPPPQVEEAGELAPDWSAADMETADDEKSVSNESGDSTTASAHAAPVDSIPQAVTGSSSLLMPESTLSSTPTQPSMKPSAQSPEDTAHSVPKPDWGDLAASLQGKPSEPVAEKSKPSSFAVPQSPALNTKTGEPASMNTPLAAAKSPAQSAEDTAHSMPEQDWADLAARFQAKPSEPVAEKPKPSSIPSLQPPAVNATKIEPASLNSAPHVSKSSAQSVEDTARSIPKKDWADFAASLQAKPSESIAEKPKSSPFPTPPPPAMNATKTEPAPAKAAPPVLKQPTQNLEDTARSIPKQYWAAMAASLQAKPVEPAVEKPKPAPVPLAQTPVEPTASTQPGAAAMAHPSATTAADSQSAPANSSTPGSPDPALVEAVVQRVLDKMRPQVVDIITKEFLRPVVQALVSREITKR